MRKSYIKNFIVTALLMTITLIISYLIMSLLFKMLALFIMICGFVTCLRKLCGDGFTAKKLILTIAASVAEIALSIFLSRLAILTLFMLK